MKRRQVLSELTIVLSFATAIGSTVTLIVGSRDFVVGIGIWMGLASIALLVLWTGGVIVGHVQSMMKGSEGRSRTTTLHDIKENSE